MHFQICHGSYINAVTALAESNIDVRKAHVLMKYLKLFLKFDRSDINNFIYEKIFEIAVELVALNDILMPRMAAR